MIIHEKVIGGTWGPGRCGTKEITTWECLFYHFEPNQIEIRTYLDLPILGGATLKTEFPHGVKASLPRPVKLFHENCFTINQIKMDDCQ